MTKKSAKMQMLLDRLKKTLEEQDPEAAKAFTQTLPELDDGKDVLAIGTKKKKGK